MLYFSKQCHLHCPYRLQVPILMSNQTKLSPPFPYSLKYFLLCPNIRCFKDIKFSLTNNKLGISFHIKSFWAAGTCFQFLYVTSTLSRATIPKYVLNFFLWGRSAFPVEASTSTTSLFAPAGLVANDHSRVAFLMCFKVDGDCDAASVGGGGGGELGGVTIGL